MSSYLCDTLDSHFRRLETRGFLVHSVASLLWGRLSRTDAGTHTDTGKGRTHVRGGQVLTCKTGGGPHKAAVRSYTVNTLLDHHLTNGLQYTEDRLLSITTETKWWKWAERRRLFILSYMHTYLYSMFYEDPLLCLAYSTSSANIYSINEWMPNTVLCILHKLFHLITLTALWSRYNHTSKLSKFSKVAQLRNGILGFHPECVTSNVLLLHQFA